jgi:hypothetical protein
MHCTSQIKDALSAIAKKEGVPEATDAMYSFFLDRVRGNLHVIICLSPIGNKFRLVRITFIHYSVINSLMCETFLAC